jgi:hypothetical protein
MLYKPVMMELVSGMKIHSIFTQLPYCFVINMNLHAFDCKIQSYIATVPDRCYRTQFRMTDFTEIEV